MEWTTSGWRPSCGHVGTSDIAVLGGMGQRQLTITADALVDDLAERGVDLVLDGDPARGPCHSISDRRSTWRQ